MNQTDPALNNNDDPVHTVDTLSQKAINKRKRLFQLIRLIAFSFVLIGIYFAIHQLLSDNQNAIMSCTKYEVLSALIAAPLLLWFILRTRYGKRLNPFNETEPVPFRIKDDADFITGCHQIIHYFDLQGKDISTTPLSLTIKPDPNFAVYLFTPPTPNAGADQQQVLLQANTSQNQDLLPQTDNIATGLSKLENKLVNRTLSDPIEKARLTLIYDYLSSALSNYDNDITVETIDEATDKANSKYANFNYAFGAIYILIVTVLCHSYMNSIDTDTLEGKAVLSTYSNLLLHKSKLKQNNVIVLDSAKNQKDSLLKVAILVADSTLNADSIKILHSLLVSRTRWIRNALSLYPLPGRIDSVDNSVFMRNLDSINAQELQSMSASWLYLSGQTADALRRFILPMLYGLVGSFLWVIRKMSDQAKTFDLTWKKLARHRARILFGLFVGMFFGYLFKTESVTSSTSVTITPFVIAFIAGYNVEVLFTFMDKIIAAFTNSSSDPKATGNSKRIA